MSEFSLRSGLAAREPLVRALLGTPLRALATLALLVPVLGWALPGLWRWAVTEAVWSGDGQACRVAAGACWAFVREKFWYFMHGAFPADLRWRANAAMWCLVLAALSIGVAGTARRRVSGWLVGMATGIVLIHGAGLLAPVRIDHVGGLLLSLLLAVGSLPLAFMLGIGLALARHDGAPWQRAASAALVEFFRCSPFVALLVVAYVTLPLLVPGEFKPPKLAWACVVFLLAAAAQMGEAVRGGLQAVPATQSLAAASLSLGYLDTVRLVMLPQALRHAVPSLANAVLTFFKNTSLVTVIGLTDFLGAVKAGAHDAVWAGYDVEGYVFAAAVYFVGCSAIGQVARRLERQPVARAALAPSPSSL